MKEKPFNNINNQKEKIKNLDVKYEPEKNPERIKEIEEKIEKPKYISVEIEGEKIQIEYIEVPAKEKESGKEEVIVIIPGFCSSYIPFANLVKELARYIRNKRIICVSPLDSGKSYSLKNSNLHTMNEAYFKSLNKMGISSDSAEATVIGHSRSDIIALELARSHPEVVKNIVLVDGISGNQKNITHLAPSFSKHILTEVMPERIKGAFKGDKEAAKNYWKWQTEFFTNFLNPGKSYNQFKSLTERKKINLDELLSELQSNVLVISGERDFTDYKETEENIYEKLPNNIKKQHRTEIGGLHDEINAHPEAFAIKLKRWLKSLEEK